MGKHVKMSEECKQKRVMHMAFDGIFTHYMVNELNEHLLNGRINKIYQVSNYELLLIIRSKETYQLLISIDPKYARIHITAMDYETPSEPPMFCMLLRKHLEGGVIESINQIGSDRIIEIKISNLNEIGDRVYKKLMVEIMGKHSNIILVNDDTNLIIDALKRISPFLNSYRTIQPGAEYILPPTQNKIDFFNGTEEDFKHFSSDSDNLARELIDYFAGVSPLSSQELLHGAILTETGLYHAYKKFINRLEKEYQPTMIITPKRDYFYLIDLKHLEGERRVYHTLGSLLDRFYFDKENQERIKQQTQDLEKFIKNEYEKNKSKLNNLTTDLELAKETLNYRKLGDLILTYAYDITQGQSVIKVVDYETNEEVEIELDPTLTPVENANKYYAKYQKAKSAITHLTDQIESTKDEISYFELLLEQMKSATLNDAIEIRQELEMLGYLKPQVTKMRKAKKPQFEKYIIDGVEILVGKNNIQNEYITHKIAGRNDYFVHVKDMPGSHVIIRNVTELTENVLRSAAQLASYYSKARKSSSVPVDYTLVKHVKKVPGSKLGFVTYDRNKTIYIDPDEDFIHQLKMKNKV